MKIVSKVYTKIINYLFQSLIVYFFFCVMLFLRMKLAEKYLLIYLFLLAGFLNKKK